MIVYSSNNIHIYTKHYTDNLKYFCLRTELGCDCNNHVPFIDCSKVHDPPTDPTRVYEPSADQSKLHKPCKDQHRVYELSGDIGHLEPETSNVSELSPENLKTLEKTIEVETNSVMYPGSSPSQSSGAKDSPNYETQNISGAEPEVQHSKTNGNSEVCSASGDSDEYSDQKNTSDLYPAVTHDTSVEYSETHKTSGMYLELPTRPRSRSNSPGRIGEKSKSSRRVSVADIKYTSVSSIYVNDVYMNPSMSCDTLDIDSIEMVDHTEPSDRVPGGFKQICVEIDSEETSTHPATFRSLPKSESGGRRSRRTLNLAVICLAKLVDLVLHGTVFGFFIYATYLSVIFCQQVSSIRQFAAKLDNMLLN